MAEERERCFTDELRVAAEEAAKRLGEGEKVKDPAGLCLFEDTLKAFIDDVRGALFPEVFCCRDGAADLFDAAKKLRCMLLSACGGDME